MIGKMQSPRASTSPDTPQSRGRTNIERVAFHVARSRIVLSLALVAVLLAVAGCAKKPPAYAARPPAPATTPAATADSSPAPVTGPPSGNLTPLGSPTIYVGTSRVVKMRFDSTGGDIDHLVLRLKGNPAVTITSAAIATSDKPDAATTAGTVTTDPNDPTTTSIDFGAAGGHQTDWLTLVLDAPAPTYWVFVANVVASSGADSTDDKVLESLSLVASIKPLPVDSEVVRYHTRWIGGGHEQVEGTPGKPPPGPAAAPTSGPSVPGGDNGG
jgi:predicted small lipoprotein YifL